jgi:drug/metabolite transporter (DMT)-like permease
VVALFTFPIMASVTEPYCFGSRPLPRQFIAALIGGCGVAQMILVSSGNDHSQTWGLGILLGLISAAFWAARGIQARSLLQGTDALTIMAVQVSVAGVLLAPALLYVAWPISLQDLGLIALFGVAFTALPHTLTVWALKHLSFTAISIIGSLQVLSAVLMASWLLEEQLTSSVWLGALLVTLAVLGESARSLFAQQAANSSESSSPSGQSNPKRK